jgi:hypothetical protein
MDNNINNNVDVDEDIDIDLNHIPHTNILSDNLDNTNGWTEKNINTVRNWKASIFKTIYTYEYIVEKYTAKIQKFMTLLLICTTLSTIISAVSSALLGTDNKSYLYAILGLNMALFIFNAISTVLNGCIKINGWSELIKPLPKFIEKLDSYYAIISGELVLPIHIRNNGTDFIKKHYTEYLNIMTHTPDISPSEKKEVSQKYLTYLSDIKQNFESEQKYHNNDSLIDII